MANNQLSNDDIFKNVRTLEDIINVLSVLYTNMNTISRNYYDLFVNPVAMSVPMKLYDENGNLVDKDIPNVASYKTPVLLSHGDPNGNLEGNVGTFCIDVDANPRVLYFKAEDIELNRGWYKVYDANSDFLEVDGDGQNLQNLGASQIVREILKVERGGTGVGEIEGLIKGNGTEPFTAAVESVDYIGPSMTGVVSYFAGSASNIPKGWLVCDGREVPKATYGNLYNTIGDTYGIPLDSNNFVLPDLIGRYVKGASTSGTLGDAVVGGHNHLLNGTQTGAAGVHTHTRGTMNIEGYLGRIDGGGSASGAFYAKGKAGKLENQDGQPDPKVYMDASRNWTGETSAAEPHTHSLDNLEVNNNHPDNPTIENDVKHITMIPIIKY